MAAPRPMPATPPGLLDDEDPRKWERVKQALWETNLNAPIRGIYNLMNADPYTLYTDTGEAGQQLVADSFDAAGGITVGSMPMPKPANSLSMGIKAYHGSPHSFDKFSMDKIGTGEGAQAYGHGLYFAENEGVAKGYRNQLSSPDGFAVTATPDAHRAHLSTLQETAKAVGEGVGQTPDEFRAAMVQHLRNAPDDIGQYAKENLNIIADDLAAGKWNVKPKNPGSMYEVEINADPNAFLDWDKPLSEQPEVVQKLRSMGALNDKGDLTFMYNETPGRGGEMYERLTSPLAQKLTGGEGQGAATEALKKAGIPGIRYLDAGSRVPSALAKKELADWQAQMSVAERELADATARGDKWLISRKQAELKRVQDGMARVSKEAEGTRNYVVFDDSLIDIIKKYGIAGLLGGSGLYGMSGEEAQAGAY